MPGACCGGCAAVNDIIIIISLEAGVGQGRGTKRPPTEIQKGEGGWNLICRLFSL